MIQLKIYLSIKVKYLGFVGFCSLKIVSDNCNHRLIFSDILMENFLSIKFLLNLNFYVVSDVNLLHRHLFAIENEKLKRRRNQRLCGEHIERRLENYKTSK